jgi:hypothetical protein
MAGVAKDLVWELVPTMNDDLTLVIIRRDSYEHWAARVPVFECRTWGELRSRVSGEVYQEVCELCGYGTLHEDTNLDVNDAAPLRLVRSTAAETNEPDTEAPGDDVLFDATDIPAYADGDWPPSVAYLVDQELPMEVLNEYGKRVDTSLNGTYAYIPAEHRPAVLERLAGMGFRLTEEEGLTSLVQTIGT